MITVNVFNGVAAPAKSTAVTAMLYVPAALGVPESAPLAAFIVTPAGRPLADQVSGLVPFAVVIAGELYPTVCSPFGSDAVVMVGVALIVTEYGAWLAETPRASTSDTVTV